MSKLRNQYHFESKHIRAMEWVMNRFGDTALAIPCRDGEIKIVRNRKELVKLEPEKDGSEN